MAKRHELAFVLAVFVLAATAFFAALHASTSKKIIIKFPHVTAPNTPKGRGAEKFKELVAERLGDRGVVVEVYPSGSLMNDDASIEAVAFGEVQMIAVSLSKFDRLTKKFQLFDLPFLFDDLDAVDRFQATDAAKELLSALENKGIHGLGFWHNGMKQFTGPRPLRLPEDASGLKFRIMESDVLQAQILAVGGNPQKMPFPETYQALQTGAIDAQENTYSNIYSSKFYEVQDYIVESNHGYLGYLLAVNKEFWNSLPDDIRAELEEIVQETTRYVNEEASAIDLAAKEKIIKEGGKEILTLTDEERAAWKRAMAPVWDQFAPDIGADLLNAALNANAPAAGAEKDDAS